MAKIKEVLHRSTISPSGETARASVGGGPEMPDAFGYGARAADELAGQFFGLAREQNEAEARRQAKLKAIEDKLAEEKRKAFEDSQVVLLVGDIAATIADAESVLKGQVVYDESAVKKTVWGDSEYPTEMPTGKIHYSEYAKKWREKAEEILNAGLAEITDPQVRAKVLRSAYPAAIAGYHNARSHQDKLEMQAHEGALKTNIGRLRMATSLLPDVESVERNIQMGEAMIRQVGGALAPDVADAAALEFRQGTYKEWSHQFAANRPQAFLDAYHDKAHPIHKHVDNDDLRRTVDKVISLDANTDKQNKAALIEFSDKWEKDVMTLFAKGEKVDMGAIEDMKDFVTREHYDRILSAKRTYETVRPFTSDELTMWGASEDIATGALRDVNKLLSRVRGKVTADDLNSLVAKLNAANDRRKEQAKEGRDEREKDRDKAEAAGKDYIQRVFEPGGVFDFDRAIGQVRALAMEEFTSKIIADKKKELDVRELYLAIVSRYARVAVDKMNENYTLEGRVGPLLDPRYRVPKDQGGVVEAEQRLFNDHMTGRITQEQWQTQRRILDRVIRWSDILYERETKKK